MLLVLINLALYFNLLSIFFEFGVNNPEWTQKRLNLLHLYSICRCSFETNKLLLQSQIKSFKRISFVNVDAKLREIAFWRVETIVGKLLIMFETTWILVKSIFQLWILWNLKLFLSIYIEIVCKYKIYTKLWRQYE